MALVRSARRHDLDVAVYVKDVLDQLLAGSTNYHALLPDVWKQTHAEAIREYRVEERRDKAEQKPLDAARRPPPAARRPPPPRRPRKPLAGDPPSFGIDLGLAAPLAPPWCRCTLTLCQPFF